ncbi:MAG: hypothetical protein LC734_03580 [Acidobacteria bacterium]|nr:hypothetical protein [Acidobacteriota bacterium]
MKVDMSPEAVRERLRLTGELREELMNANKIDEEKDEAESHTEIHEAADHGGL